MFSQTRARNRNLSEISVKTVAGTALSMNGMAGYLWDDSDSGGHKYFSRKTSLSSDEEIGKSFIELSGSGYNPGTMDWVSTTVEQTKDNSGNPVAGSYQITVGSSSKVKIDLSCNKTRVGGTATLSYWDKNANSGQRLVGSERTLLQYFYQ